MNSSIRKYDFQDEISRKKLEYLPEYCHFISGKCCGTVLPAFRCRSDTRHDCRKLCFREVFKVPDMKNKASSAKQEASIEDVARLAGVSCASVSRVINHLGNVSPQMEKKVWSAVEELHFRPNPFSRTLRSGKTNTIAIYQTFHGQKDDLYGEGLIQKLTSFLSQQKYRVILELLNSLPNGLHVLDPVAGPNRQVDGICIVGHLETGDLEYMATWNLPICLLNFAFDNPNFLSVNLADDIGSEEAVQYLIALGRRRLAFVYGNLQWLGPRRRLEGFLAAHRKFGIEPDPDFLVQVDFSEQNYIGGFHAVEKLLALPERPDAILFINDWYAVGGLAALQKNGIAVPEEISLIGFDNSWLANQVIPALTSVSLEPDELCSLAVDALIRRIENRPLLRPLTPVRPRLVIRDSCVAK